MAARPWEQGWREAALRAGEAQTTAHAQQHPRALALATQRARRSRPADAPARRSVYYKRMERGQTVTLNSHYFQASRDSFSGALRRRYYARGLGGPGSDNIKLALQHLRAAGFGGVREDDLYRLVKDDEGVAPLVDTAAATLACERARRARAARRPRPGGAGIWRPLTAAWPPRQGLAKALVAPNTVDPARPPPTPPAPPPGRQTSRSRPSASSMWCP